MQDNNIGLLAICDGTGCPNCQQRTLTVAYLSNGGIGSFVDSGSVPGSSYIIKTNTEVGISRAGFFFTGWNTRPDGSGVPYQPGTTIFIYSSQTFYAQWSTFFVTTLDVTMGTTFRTVDTLFSYGADAPIAGSGTIYYLLQKPGLPAPDAQTIINFNDQAALADGTVARGQFAVTFSQTVQTQKRTLSGREVLSPYSDETGVVDGYRYVLYMVGLLNGLSSDTSTTSASALGMPFGDGLGTIASPFGLREIDPLEMTKWPDLLPGHPINRAGVTETARMLDNIEGMLVLFEDTADIYGLNSTLGDAYLLRTDFDLAGYADAYQNTGWRPIGNQNTALTNGGSNHIFTGSMTTDGPRRLISNLYINQISSDSNVVSYLGLFGFANNAVISGFDITGANLNALITDGYNGHVGALAGTMVGTLDTFTLTSSSANATGSGLIDVSGVVGTFYSTDCRNITLSDVTVSVTGGNSSTAGGFAGHFAVLGQTSATVADCTVTDVNITSNGSGGAFISAFVFMDAGGGATIRNCKATGSVTGNLYVGGLIGLLGGNSDRNPADCIVSGCTASADVIGDNMVGGLIGNVERTTVQNCSVLSGSVRDLRTTTSLSRPFGGLIGSFSEGSLSDCTAAIDVLVPLSSRAGGLIGTLVTISTAFTYNITNCSASGNVSAVSYVGGLVGGYTTGEAIVTFTNCFATGSITGSATADSVSAGGMIGSGQLALYTDCYATGAVQGRSNLGGFIGDSSAAQFTGCYSRGNVTGVGISVGGFIGASTSAKFSRCFCTGNVTASTSNAGGFVSNFLGGSSIDNCYATGNCEGTGNVAGLVQGISGGCTINHCYASGSITATLAAGGVVAAGFGGTPNPVSNNFALNPLVAAGGNSVIGRVAASSSLLTLTTNSAISTLALTRGGISYTPAPGNNTKDGATVTLAGLEAAMQAAGWSSLIWDFSTIATLGRPILVSPSET